MEDGVDGGFSTVDQQQKKRKKKKSEREREKTEERDQSQSHLSVCLSALSLPLSPPPLLSLTTHSPPSLHFPIHTALVTSTLSTLSSPSFFPFCSSLNFSPYLTVIFPTLNSRFLVDSISCPFLILFTFRYPFSFSFHLFFPFCCCCPISLPNSLPLPQPPLPADHFVREMSASLGSCGVGFAQEN